MGFADYYTLRTTIPGGRPEAARYSIPPSLTASQSHIAYAWHATSQTPPLQPPWTVPTPATANLAALSSCSWYTSTNFWHQQSQLRWWAQQAEQPIREPEAHGVLPWQETKPSMLKTESRAKSRASSRRVTAAMQSAARNYWTIKFKLPQ